MQKYQNSLLRSIGEDIVLISALLRMFQYEEKIITSLLRIII